MKEKPPERGWMLKMGGSNVGLRSGSEVSGKYGQYLLKTKIGEGGNGAVFEVDVISKGMPLPVSDGYVIKVLTVKKRDKKENAKRYLRFKKEIECVLDLQKTVKGIIPIYDTSIICSDRQKQMWYVMPKAKQFSPKGLSVKDKLEYMMQLGTCIMQLHELNYAHRDIKPQNILLFKGYLCLSDFGLVCNNYSKSNHITEVRDRMGPYYINPPELQYIEQLDGIDYCKSDVYLFAKTLWMVLQNNRNGFASEYSRNRDDVYLYKDKLQVETVEPLHCLMEKATKYNYWERIDIEDCLHYINSQLRIIRGEIPQSDLLKWKYEEESKRLRDTISPDERTYSDLSTITRIMESMAGIAGLVFVEAGKEFAVYSLRKARCIQNAVFEIEIMNRAYFVKKKTIRLAIGCIIHKSDLSYEINTNGYCTSGDQIPSFSRISEVLETPFEYVCLNTKCIIKMAQLSS